MMRSLTFLSLLFLLALISGLHLQEETTKLLDELRKQQNVFEASINGIMENINKIDNQVSGATKIDDKILILENAILSQRDQIFQLSTELIPPFNISKASCQKMTDQQKVILLQKLSNARQQIKNLKNLTDQLPQCDEKTYLLQDIKKQMTFLDSIQSIIYTDCSMNVILSPTIFQTNIYSKNWILGNLTIDNLIQQYYQRSTTYENVTNCPIQFPFFDGRQCIICEGQTPIFNISSKKCVNCGNGVIDNSKKACLPPVYYTNWSNVQNYDDGGQPLPETPTGENAVPCPPEKPYSNGEQCISCQFPKYFSVTENLCKDCAADEEFDENEKQCKTIEPNMLTKLQGTRWVTDNQTVYDVLKEREAILQKNETLGSYQQCPAYNPYFDGITCISCLNEFSLDELKCTAAPEGSSFDSNVHRYLPPQDKETFPNAPNLIGNQLGDHEDIQNCNESYPYYDGVACINCSQPFYLFDISTKRCTVCSPEKYYNQTLKQCVDRPIVYISQNEDKLLATPTFSIDDYQDQITKVTSDPNAIVLNCENEKDYSNFQTCFPCAADEYFNVDYKTCQKCEDGHINETTNICVKNTHYLTNLNASGIVDLPNDLQTEKDKQQQILSQYDNVKVCDISTPYYNGTSCIKCEAPLYFFDYKNKTCIGCPENLVYFEGECKQLLQTNNISALQATGVIETPPNYTIAELQKQNDKLAQDGVLFVQCPEDYPYYNQTRARCINCQEGYAIDLQKNLCVKCEYYDSQKKACYTLPTFSNITSMQQSKYIEHQPNYTLDALNNQIQNYSDTTQRPYKQCPAQTPFYSTKTSSCISCETTQAIDLQTGECLKCDHYDNETKTCYNPGMFSNVSALNQTQYVETQPNDTLASIQDQIDNYTNTTGHDHTECPADSPYYNQSSAKCTSCQDKQALDLASGKCIPCQFYDSQTKQCYAMPTFSNVEAIQQIDYIEEPPEYTLDQIQQDIANYSNQTHRPYKKCPPETPFYSTKNQTCVNCEEGLYFNLKLEECVQCATYNNQTHTCQPPVPHYPNLTNTNWTTDNSTITDVVDWTNQLKSVPGAVECPEGQQFYNNFTKLCQSCPENTYFNYDRFVCEDCSPKQYDYNIKKCLELAQPNTYQTSLNSSNLTGGGLPFNQYQDYYDSNKTAYPDIQDCPEETPYYDGINCIMCPSQFPYFNLRYRRCQTCPDGSQYDAVRRQCISDSGTTVQNDPNPAKMYANIFHQQARTFPSEA